jgi:hypothetical protein
MRVVGWGWGRDRGLTTADNCLLVGEGLRIARTKLLRKKLTHVHAWETKLHVGDQSWALLTFYKVNNKSVEDEIVLYFARSGRPVQHP